MRLLIISLFAAAWSSPVVAQSQFDLICVGESRLQLDGEPPEVSEFNAHYRIDLDRRIWCGAECPGVNPLGPASSYRLELSFRSSSILPMDNLVIDRTTGEMSQFERMGSSYSSIRATCRKAPFTPIPQALF